METWFILPAIKIISALSYPICHYTFAKELSKYEGAKRLVKFPIDELMLFKLISSIVEFR